MKSNNTAFKALMRETSVYKYFIELKENIFTENGYFDIVKVPGLRIAGAGQSLKNLRIEKKLTQKELAKLLNVPETTVYSWEHEKAKIPLQKLVKFAEDAGISRDTIYSLIDRGKFKTKTALPVKFEKIRDIIRYLSPEKSKENKPYFSKNKSQIHVIKCSKEIISKIKAALKVNVFSGSRSKGIKSKELCNYLTTFFRYTEVPKICPPLTSEVKLWYDKRVDLKRAIVCPCLQSDGSIVKYDNSLKMSGNSQVLHNYFVDAMYYEYKELPSTYFTRGDSDKCNITKYSRKTTRTMIEDVFRLAGNTKTSPANGQPVDDYLNEPQPHLNYLTNASETEQKIALRIWASTEGYITIFKNTDGKLYLRVGISCAHPNLAIQLQQIAKQFNIQFALVYTKKNWSGIQELHTNNLISAIEFLKLGGFIKGIQISANSEYHEGIDKDILMLGILEFFKRKQTNQIFKKLPIKRIHHEINKIIKNKQYNSADNYIDYFSEDDTTL